MANILVIEDEKAVQENISDILELNGYNVLVASNGKQGLLISKTIQPDLIITDLMMPIMDGFEFIQKLKQDKSLSRIPVIVLSAKTSNDDVALSINLGVLDFIKKPFNNFELLTSVKRNII